jgi:Ras-related protein Rab-1A
MGACSSQPAATDTSNTTVGTQNAGKASDYDYMCKLLLLGDSGVGKSALMMRFADDSFKGSFMSTVGIDFKMKTIQIDGKRVKIQIWDTAGQERFRTITKTYYRGAHGYVLVYDITSAESFEHVKYWLGEIKKNGNEDVHKVIVGNKADLEDQRMVKFDEGKAFSDEKNIPFLETSAKDGLNVQDLFMRMTRGYLKLAMTQSPN